MKISERYTRRSNSTIFHGISRGRENVNFLRFDLFTTRAFARESDTMSRPPLSRHYLDNFFLMLHLSRKIYDFSAP